MAQQSKEVRAFRREMAKQQLLRDNLPPGTPRCECGATFGEYRIGTICPELDCGTEVRVRDESPAQESLKNFIDDQIEQRRTAKREILAGERSPETHMQRAAEASLRRQQISHELLDMQHMSVRRRNSHAVCVLEQPDGLSEVWEQAGRDPNATILVHTYYYDSRLFARRWSPTDQGTK